MENNRLLVVDDEGSVRRLLYEIGTGEGYQVDCAVDGIDALEKARQIKPAVVIMDIRMPGMDGLDVLEVIQRDIPDTTVILMTAYGTVETAMEAVKKGAFDYIIKPSDVREVRALLARAFLQAGQQNGIPGKEGLPEKKRIAGDIIGQSVLMQRLYRLLGRVSPTNTTVLITGESGSGKGLIAKTIHENSLRGEYPFIKVNCGALPEHLMESELFGYEKGAFTGATARKPGRFELAQKGTIFLDEVAELPLPLQVKLLRVLQEREFERVGGTETIIADVRIIAATNKDLDEMVRKGSMREDLYYRLNVFPICVPSLRERKEDIPLFVDHFISLFSNEMNRKPPIVTEEAMQMIGRYSWPGNVRELANVIERAIIMSAGAIGVEDLPGLFLAKQAEEKGVPAGGTLKSILQDLERKVIAQTLQNCRGNKAQTAKVLDISRRALLYKIEQYRL